MRSDAPVAFNNSFTTENSVSAIAWPVIIGGALAAVAVSLVLLILGSALGLSALSPWSHGETATALTVKAAIWLIVMQWIASVVGGYLTGRLRTKWSDAQQDEVFFRDTAHGFLAWALATVIAASLLTSAASSIASGGAKAATVVATGAAARATNEAAKNADSNVSDPTIYYVDTLFRSDTVTTNDSTQNFRSETLRILATGITGDTVSEADKAYLARLVANHTNLTPEATTQRVNEVLAQLQATKEKAKQKAEEARKAAMKLSLYTVLSMLIGAFIASAAAALGGRHRDEYHVTRA